MTWNTAVPAGTDLVSQGDDVIREFKTDVQTSLVATEGAPLSQDAGAFPGADINNPKYHYRGLKGSTADRPAATHYGLYFNTTTGTLQRSNGTTWEDISTSGIPSGSSTDNAIARFNGTDGQIQNSGVILDDANNVTGVNDLEVLDDINIGGGVVITGTTGHSVTEEFANEVWEEYARPTGTSVGVRGVAISAESGSFVVTTSGYTDIGVSAELVTTGRPVWVGLTCDASLGYIGMRNPDPSADIDIRVRIQRDGTTIYEAIMNLQNPVTGGFDNLSNIVYTCPGQVWTVTTQAAGTWEYTVQFSQQGSAGNGFVSVDNLKIIAFEL